MNYIFTKIGNIFFNIKITDILYTYVIGNTDQAKKLSLKQKDFRFCVELPIKAQKQNMKLSTVNCFERRRIAGEKKVNAFKDGYLILSHMIKLFFEKKMIEFIQNYKFQPKTFLIFLIAFFPMTLLVGSSFINCSIVIIDILFLFILAKNVIIY